SEVIIGPAAVATTSISSGGSSIPAAAIRSRSLLACITPISAQARAARKGISLSPAGRGERELPSTVVPADERVPALQPALARQPWMRERDRATGDGWRRRPGGADDRPARPAERGTPPRAERCARRVPHGGRGAPDAAEARRRLQGRPADLERGRARPRGEPGAPGVSEASRVAARPAEPGLRMGPCQLPRPDPGRRDRLRRAVI